MPAKATKPVVLALGSLVMTSQEIYTLPGSEPLDDPIYPGGRTSKGIAAGTIGIIVKRPDQVHPRQFLVNFLGGSEWWIYATEIEPYHKEEENV